MREHRYENIRGVLVDECYGCGGFFLDAGELRAIREALGARKEKHENVEAVLARDLAFQTNRVMSDAEKQRIEMLVLISKIFTRLYVGGVGL
jgi:Zn-finger nucleic acid-binding protein